jgi:hypothetical protein
VNIHAASVEDLWLEQIAEQADPLAGPAQRWPRYDFVDEGYWCLGPPPEEEPVYDPTPEDVAFLAELPPIAGGAPVEPDWDDRAELAAFEARLDAMNQGREIGGSITDQDIQAAGLPVG